MESKVVDEGKIENVTEKDTSEFLMDCLDKFVEKAKATKVTSIALSYIDENGKRHAEMYMTNSQHIELAEQLTEMSNVIKDAVKNDGIGTPDITTSKTLN